MAYWDARAWETTLLNCIAGHLPVASGRMTPARHWRPAAGSHPPSAQSRSAIGIGYVPQDKRIFSQLSVEENLHIALAAGKPGLTPAAARFMSIFPSSMPDGSAKAPLPSDDESVPAGAGQGADRPAAAARSLMNPRAAEGRAACKSWRILLLRLNRDIGLTGAARRAAPALDPPGGGSLLCLAPGP